MERVTQKNERGYYLLGDGIYSDWGVPEKFRGDAVDRLAAYEDTGLEPEEIKATFTPEAVIKLAAQALGTTPDRLRELAQADREKNDPLTLDELRGMRFVRLSCDTASMLPVIEQAAAYMREAGIAPSRFWCYMLVQDVDEAHRRALALDKLGITPFAQPYRDYDGGEPTTEQRRFARWVNMRAAFKSCKWEDFRG